MSVKAEIRFRAVRRFSPARSRGLVVCSRPPPAPFGDTKSAYSVKPSNERTLVLTPLFLNLSKANFLSGLIPSQEEPQQAFYHHQRQRQSGQLVALDHECVHQEALDVGEIVLCVIVVGNNKHAAIERPGVVLRQGNKRGSHIRHANQVHPALTEQAQAQIVSIASLRPDRMPVLVVPRQCRTQTSGAR